MASRDFKEFAESRLAGYDAYLQNNSPSALNITHFAEVAWLAESLRRALKDFNESQEAS